MFPKTVCGQNKQGQRRDQAVAFIRSLLSRWRIGERRGLWDEAVMAVRKRGPGRSQDNTSERREADVCRLVSLGCPGQAAKCSASPGLAEYNEVVKHKLLAKFPPNPNVALPHLVQA